MRIVIAVGGNALLKETERGTWVEQLACAHAVAEAVVTLHDAGHQVVLTHGNGPQVGNLLVKNELAAHEVPPVPLDWCVAQYQDARSRELQHRKYEAREVERCRVVLDVSEAEDVGLTMAELCDPFARVWR